jgi:hypothetical protein
MSRRAFLSVLTLASLTASSAAAQHWPQFRGPHGAATADGAALPDTWSITEHVAWSVTMAGAGWSSPIVWGDRLYVTSAITEGEYLSPRSGLFGMALFNRLVDEGLSEAEADAAVVARDVELTRGDSPPVRWMLYCLDTATGRILWFREVHSARHRAGGTGRTAMRRRHR